ncbi:MAG: DUF1800 domain-containing protein [Verrucomicrobiota bacterium]|nr:DUF1800 domain-containing protein [Verrucomicrobiota bacterium]
MLNPLPAGKWNYTTAAHLFNRAGFGGTPSEIESLLKLGPEKAVSHFVDYEKIPDETAPPDWAKPDSDLMTKLQIARKIGEEMRAAKSDEERRKLDMQRREMVREEQKKQGMQILDLRGWWLKKMTQGQRPLQEKLTLFWHGHFATSVQKVKYSYFMYLQNQTFRKLASGNWQALLEAMAQDPAMLIWLDQAQSRKEHPNENFARELMELFALGEGHYTEKDVTEAARALTGFSLSREKQGFQYRPFFHDDGIKTFLGRTEKLDGRDVLEQIVEQPQSAKFISAKLWTFFASENPAKALVESLATVFRKNGNEFKPLLRALFRSEEFYSDSVIRNQVKSPVQWLVGSTRLLERDLPAPLVSSVLLRQLGQELFAPPNVKGWDGGLSWITTNNLLTRYNQAALLVLSQVPITSEAGEKKKFRMIAERAKEMAGKMPVVDVSKILSETERKNKEALMPALEKRFLQTNLKEKQRLVLRDFLESRGELDDGDIRQTIRLLMSTPEYQLT